MRTYFNPEMNIASFDREAVATTASAALQTWQEQDTEKRFMAEVDFRNMTAVIVEF